MHYAGCTHGIPPYINSSVNDIERRKLRFFAISSLHLELSPTPTLKWPGHIRMQITCIHTGRLSRLTTCGMSCSTRYEDSQSLDFDRVQIAFILALFRWLKTFTDEGGEYSQKKKKQQQQQSKTKQNLRRRAPENDTS